MLLLCTVSHGSGYESYSDLAKTITYGVKIDMAHYVFPKRYIPLWMKQFVFECMPGNRRVGPAFLVSNRNHVSDIEIGFTHP